MRRKYIMLSIFKKKEKEVNTVVCSDDEFVAVANGTLVPLENVSDPAFASKMMGGWNRN